MINRHLNERTLQRLAALESATDDLRIEFINEPNVSRVVDFGVDQPGGLQAGLELARICLGELGNVDLVAGCGSGLGEAVELGTPLVQVYTDHPLVACMGSQYGGWQLQTDNYFAIGSGPMRAARGKETVLVQYDLFEREKHAVGVLETSSLPDLEVIQQIADECEIKPFDVTLCVAPTRSLAGTIQIVARSVEATMHKLFELGADLSQVSSGFGTAPLPPVSADDLTAIGRTNDSILYGGRVTLWVAWSDETINEIGPRVPSNSSTDHGTPFVEIFKASGGDFYALDPLLFSAAQISLVSTVSGNSFTFGETRCDILQQSFSGPVST